MTCRVRPRESVAELRRELVRLAQDRLGGGVIAVELVAEPEPEEGFCLADPIAACAEGCKSIGEGLALARLQSPLAQRCHVKQLTALERGGGRRRVAQVVQSGGGAVVLGEERAPDVGVSSNVSVLANRGDGTFEARRKYPTGRNPFAVAIGDLDGDGKRDLVTAGGGGVSVLLNRGDGRFGSRRSYQTELLAWSVALGDLNGDRKLDVATTDGSFHVGILLNTTGLCTVPNVLGKPLPVARRAFARASCRVGNIRLANSKLVTKGRVISERPKPGVVLPRGGMISLVVSRGRK